MQCVLYYLISSMCMISPEGCACVCVKPAVDVKTHVCKQHALQSCVWSKQRWSKGVCVACADNYNKHCASVKTSSFDLVRCNGTGIGMQGASFEYILSETTTSGNVVQSVSAGCFRLCCVWHFLQVLFGLYSVHL